MGGQIHGFSAETTWGAGQTLKMTALQFHKPRLDGKTSFLAVKEQKELRSTENATLAVHIIRSCGPYGLAFAYVAWQ